MFISSLSSFAGTKVLGHFSECYQLWTGAGLSQQEMETGADNNARILCNGFDAIRSTDFQYLISVPHELNCKSYEQENTISAEYECLAIDEKTKGTPNECYKECMAQSGSVGTSCFSQCFGPPWGN